MNDAKTISIRNFNKKLMEDERVSISMVSLFPLILWLYASNKLMLEFVIYFFARQVPIGDGMTICRKR